jgi:sugar lactone lactonase YvrE
MSEINRRDFVVGVGSVVVAGCGGEAPSGNSVAAPQAVAASETVWYTSTFAGGKGLPYSMNPQWIQGSANGTGSSATFASPEAVAIDSSGNVYVVDSGNSVIRKITPDAVVSTFAGVMGVPGDADGYAGTAGQFGSPIGVAIDPRNDELIVLDSLYLDVNYNSFGSDRIRKVARDGRVSTLAGSQIASGWDNGIGTAATFYANTAIAVDRSGNAYVVDNSAARMVRKITPNGVVTTLAGHEALTAGSADGTGTDATFSYMYGVAVDSSGNVFVADYNNYRIRKVTPNGVVTTLPLRFEGRRDRSASPANLARPYGIAVDAQNNLYVSEPETNNVIYYIPGPNYDSAKVIGGSPTGGGYIAATNRYESGGWQDGTSSLFSGPAGMAIDKSGNVFVAELGNLRVRKITPYPKGTEPQP